MGPTDGGGGLKFAGKGYNQKLTISLKNEFFAFPHPINTLVYDCTFSDIDRYVLHLWLVPRSVESKLDTSGHWHVKRRLVILEIVPETRLWKIDWAVRLPRVHNRTHKEISTEEELVIQTVGGITIHPTPGVVVITSSIVIKYTYRRLLII